MSKGSDIDHALKLQAEYEKRFGECPVGMIQLGEEKFVKVLQKALDAGTPLPDSYFADVPEGAHVY